MTVEDILSPDLLEELHNFLWIEPLKNRGEFDPGWNCRDHAFIIACILTFYGFQIEFLQGKVMFVRGPSKGKHPMGFGQEADKGWHTWLRVKDYGHLDVSPNLIGGLKPGWTTIPFIGIFAGKWTPVGMGQVVFCDLVSDYSHQIAAASHAEDKYFAIYCALRSERMTREIVDSPDTFINSPLTIKLKQNFKGNIYLNLVSHLLRRIEKSRKSLANISRNKAWSLINEISSSEVSADMEEIMR